FALLKAELPRSLKRLVAPKGSVALDGVSLTVAAVRGACFEAALVPHTLSRTNLARRRAGESVNLEADLVARYVAAALGR
ncbi:MAG: bifunctional 3,4-dihydroxy-2-butanone-4-phosphate synthase/GTP cyclohydrolase II, partial [Elusimicrobia bacterium]|nr:bifunctional 3,4-dihydroxy-2-butanone-4-phosphate synthase/GTP cyclohydrolase II [Elusimicrobiota bacterium]